MTICSYFNNEIISYISSVFKLTSFPLSIYKIITVLVFQKHIKTIEHQSSTAKCVIDKVTNKFFNILNL